MNETVPLFGETMSYPPPTDSSGNKCITLKCTKYSLHGNLEIDNSTVHTIILQSVHFTLYKGTVV